MSKTDYSNRSKNQIVSVDDLAKEKLSPKILKAIEEINGEVEFHVILNRNRVKMKARANTDFVEVEARRGKIDIISSLTYKGLLVTTILIIFGSLFAIF